MTAPVTILWGAPATLPDHLLERALDRAKHLELWLRANGQPAPAAIAAEIVTCLEDAAQAQP